MSEDTPKIAKVEKTVKIKDPKRVEAVKRLATISKEAKQRKARERLGKDKSMEGWDINYGYVIGGAVVIVGAGSLHYAYENNKREEIKAEKIEETVSERVQSAKKDKKPKLDSFD